MTRLPGFDRIPKSVSGASSRISGTSPIMICAEDTDHIAELDVDGLVALLFSSCFEPKSLCCGSGCDPVASPDPDFSTLG